MQVQLQYENERSRREEIETQLATKLEHEMNARKQLEVEVKQKVDPLSYISKENTINEN